MNQHDDFDDFLERIQPLTPQEQREIILGYFTGVLDRLSPAAVVEFREHLRREFPPGAAQDEMFEVIDGHLALRTLKP